MTLRIQCWSGPRNISTAFMYSWAQRSDTTVYDEPLYAAYLAREGKPHPMAAETMQSQSTDHQRVIDGIILGPCDTPVLFLKQMAHHLRGLPDTGFLGHTENILLIRHPDDMLRSLSVQMPDCGLDDTGLPEQVDLLERVLGEGGEPVVIDSQVLLADPPGVIKSLCERLGLAFDQAMLSWPAGPKPYDGVWEAVWYANVHQSTGFGPPRPSRHDPLPDRLQPILAEALPLYERLVEYSLRTG